MSRPASRLTARDYKRGSRRSPLDLSRFRDLGIGLAVGVFLTSAVFIYKSDARKAIELDAPRPEPGTRATAAGDAEGNAANAEGGERSGQGLTGAAYGEPDLLRRGTANVIAACKRAFQRQHGINIIADLGAEFLQLGQGQV